MTSRLVRWLLAAPMMWAITACGGGGASNSGGAGAAPPPPPTFSSALDFESPSNFLSGPYVTERLTVSVDGELNSVTIPRGICPGTPPDDYVARWTNEANGQSGSAVIAIGCVTIIGIPGVRTQFSTEPIVLETDSNRITFETFRGNTQLGRDEIVIVREDNTPPQISSIYPDDGQVAIPTDHSLAAIFDEPMDSSMMTADRFQLLDSGGAVVAGQADYLAASNAWVFRPAAPLAPNTSHSVTISGAVEDAGGGNALGNDMVWSFVTGGSNDMSAPFVDVQWPDGGCDCAPTATRVLAGLNELVDPTSVMADSMRVTVAGVPVAGETVYRGTYIEFEPASELLSGQEYEVVVSAALRDAAGLPMAADHVWTFTPDSRPPAGSWSGTSEVQPPTAMAGAKAVWTGAEVLIWGHSGGGSFDPVSNTWNVNVSVSAGGPAPRFDHSVVWTGDEMIIWGGRGSTLADADILGGGGAFNVSSDAWTEIAPPNVAGSYATYDHVAVWTGTEMIVWGGMADLGGALSQPVDSGWQYDVGTGVATAFSGANAPIARAGAHAVWTGTEMIVWGGVDANGTALSDGARYSPITDSWSPLPPAAPTLVAGVAASIVWTGTELLVWNGGQTEEGQTLNDRLRVPTLHAFDPLLNTWRVSTSGWEPFLAGNDPLLTSFSASGYRAFWTGDRMFVAALKPGDRSYLYDPVADSWHAVADVLGLSRANAAAVWAGSRFVVWGGTIGVLPRDDGLLFQP